MKRNVLPTKLIVMTIGHSTRPVKKFIRLLKAHQVKRLVDVRTVPRSRHNPQFNRSNLSPALHSARLYYTYMPGLGGFRHASRDSLNTGWHNASFRGFADYMQTPEFRENLARTQQPVHGDLKLNKIRENLYEISPVPEVSGARGKCHRGCHAGGRDPGG